MPATGGLKLEVHAGMRDDRRARFAQIALSCPDNEEEVVLVADARGRMRYRLPEGEYRLSLLDGGPGERFVVRNSRWTTVRLQLP